MSESNLLRARLLELEERISCAARRSGRETQPIKLVAVSKKQPIELMLELEELYRCRNSRPTFGESYVQEFKKKKDQLSAGSETHLIGPLQSNKVRDAVRLFEVIESIHSAQIARAVCQEAQKINKRQRVLLQVNISDDPAKHGFLRRQLGEFIAQELPALENLDFLGLMTITRFYPKPEDVRPDFRALKELGDSLGLLPGCQRLLQGRTLELSMGMSDDFEIAIEEGATWVRIGTALFGERRQA